jgi:acyl carrier protein
MTDPRRPTRSLIDRVTAVLRDVLDDAALDVDERLSHADVEAWDSFSHITLIVALEEAFAVEFDGEEIAELTDVAAILAALRRHGADDRP